VPVASKNTSSGEVPDLRAANARNVSPPLVALQEGPFTATIETFTVTERLALPPGPMQLSVYVVVLLSVPVPVLPLTGSSPDQPPEAVQLLAFVVDHMSCAVPPLLTLVGLALRKTLGVIVAGPFGAVGDDPCPVTLVPGPPSLFSDTPSHPLSNAISAQHSATRKNCSGRRIPISATRI